MNAAIDPYGGFRHSLSDPRDDSFGHREEQTKFYTPQPRVVRPASPCSIMPTCGKGANHLGGCDHGYPLELITIPYSEFINSNPKRQTMKLESSGTFAKFQTPGTKYMGLFVKYDQDVYNQKFDKENDLLTIRLKDGELCTVTCTGNLKGLCRNNIDKMQGKVITIAWNGETKDTGKGNAMKVYEVDVDEPKVGSKAAAPTKAQHRTVQAPPTSSHVNVDAEDDSEIPF